ncbi:rhodopsin, GQ-coupled-like [Stylophora pistillata]|uniref:rhodopsin, GQ-coupled-like n=1 Tax=Stylophora pistillata TaxID=50429 RepID=UPI000C0507B5|nr:rhodopsin, GQ-coupled-like [Stylophora pistillata]
MYEEVRLLAGIVSLPIFICNVIGNALVVAVVKMNKKMQCPNTYLLSWLALSDLSFGCIAETNIYLLATGFDGRLYGTYMFHTLQSILVLTLLSIERYLAILKPFYYKANVTKSRVGKLLVINSAFTAIVSAPSYHLLGNGYVRLEFCTNPNLNEAATMGYLAVLLVISITIPGIIMFSCYSRIVKHIWFSDEANKPTNKALLRSRWKLTKIFIAATIVFVISWSPSFGILSAKSVRCSKRFVLSEAIYILLAMLGSMANPIMYSFRCPGFRQAVKVLFSKKCCKNDRTGSRNTTLDSITGRISRTDNLGKTEVILLSVRKA